MRTHSLTQHFAGALGAAVLIAFAPTASHAQSGKWVATISQLGSAGGAADVTIEPRNDKQSRAKIVFRNSKSNLSLKWDIAEGNCRDDGKPIAPQAAFAPITTQMDGGGTANANIPKLESGKQYYVRVFDPQSAGTDATAFGCANISEKP
jgi:hypothetical protein